MIDRIDMRLFRVSTAGLLLLWAAALWPLQAQDRSDASLIQISQDANEKYGPSPQLLNGEKYYYPYRAVRGNPFFEVKGNPAATIQINGKVFDKQRINYDIYNHFIVLDFIDKSGAPGSIVLRNEWVENLSLGGYTFKKYRVENGSEKFGQVIFEGRYSCVYFWEKAYKPDVQNGERTYRFSDPIRQASIFFQEHFYPFAGKRSFLSCFPKQYQVPIKAYMKENRIRIRKAPDLVMQSLVAYINQLPDHED